MPPPPPHEEPHFGLSNSRQRSRALLIREPRANTTTNTPLESVNFVKWSARGARHRAAGQRWRRRQDCAARRRVTYANDNYGRRRHWLDDPWSSLRALERRTKFTNKQTAPANEAVHQRRFVRLLFVSQTLESSSYSLALALKPRSPMRGAKVFLRCRENASKRGCCGGGGCEIISRLRLFVCCCVPFCCLYLFARSRRWAAPSRRASARVCVNVN